jgi:hypothetical protein
VNDEAQKYEFGYRFSPASGFVINRIALTTNAGGFRILFTINKQVLSVEG